MAGTVCDVSLPDVTVKECSGLGEILSFLKLSFREGMFSWLFWIPLIWSLGKTQWYLIVYDNKAIGGIGITNLPIMKYKPYNWFDTEARMKIDLLRRQGYKTACYFMVKSTFRNKGIATYLFQNVGKKILYGVKLYFTSSPGAVPFYLRIGATLALKKKHSIYTLQPHHCKG